MTDRKPALDGRTRAKLERDLQNVSRRSRGARALADEADAQRDRVIRDAHAAGMTPTEISAQVELSTNRIDQIRRGTRT